MPARRKTFRLDPRLKRDSVPVATLPLCSVRLMNRSQFPWLLLVPRRGGCRQMHELAPADRLLLVEEVARACRALETLFSPDRVNVGALGNIVPQLHVHVVARTVDDPAWPGPVWGFSPAPRFASERALRARAAALGKALARI